MSDFHETQSEATILTEADFEAGGDAPPFHGPLASCSEQIIALSKSHKLGERTVSQRIVYALTAHTLFEYRSEVMLVILGVLLVPFTVVFGVTIGFVIAGGLGWILAQIGLANVLVGVFIFLAWIMAKVFKDGRTEHSVTSAKSGERVDSLKLGQLEEIFSIAGPATYGLFLGTFFGVQMAILMFVPDHLGLPIEGEFGECFLLTLDNACHGVFLDTFELYDIVWGQPLEHGNLSATVFLAFRLAYDVLAFVIGYAVWKRFQIRHLFHGFPHDVRDVDKVLNWIEVRCADNERWPGRYYDEFLFLLLAKEFINSEYTFVTKLAHNLKSLRVDQQVRNLFLSPNGLPVFPPAPIE